ncbi:MAG: MBL fold metallo-hydrolase [Saezia sp.]
MAMRFKSLGSGSTGNALVVEKRAQDGRMTRVLIDCGFSQKELVLRLAQAGLMPEDISAIFITHEHTDHIGCAPGFAKRWNIPLWMSEGTALTIKGGYDIVNTHFANDGRAFDVGCLRLTPFTVPHDAREPLQIKIDDGRKKLGIVTDLGTVTDYVLKNIYRCDALVLESNHDPKMLLNSNYPASVKKRVASDYGHLSNEMAVDLLREVKHESLQHVVLAHLSQQNNLREIVAQQFSTVLGCVPEEVCIADADKGTDWLVVS